MPRSTDWTRNETLAAFHIYLQLPFGQLHRNQPRIVQLSQWIGRTADAIAMKLGNLASLDPQIVASGRRGMGNASKLDQQIWNEFLAANDPVVTEAATSFGHYAEQNGLPHFVDVLDDVPDIALGKTTTAIVQVRVNQARFRRAILASYNATCCMSGLRVPKLLVASHIVPWSMDTQNRLNPSNGLLNQALQGLFDSWAVAPLDTPRSRPAGELAQALTNLGQSVKSYPSVEAALQGQCAHATGDDQIVLFGSFFCVAQALQWLAQQAPEGGVNGSAG